MQSCSLRRISHYLGFKSAGVAPLPSCFRKLLDETVNNIAVFPSCLHFLVCDDNCMLSVPLSASDLHYSRWQSGGICHGLSTGAFTLLCHVLLTSIEGFALLLVLLLLLVVVLPARLSARCLLSSRPDTAFIRSCLLLPPGFTDTREVGI